MRIADPPGMIGTKKANGIAHQFGIAEMAFAQMVFAQGRKAGQKADEEIIVNQSGALVDSPRCFTALTPHMQSSLVVNLELARLKVPKTCCGIWSSAMKTLEAQAIWMRDC